MTKKIFLNPGHGGHDPGATGNSLREKDVVLKLGKRIEDKLNGQYSGHTVKLFRSNDSFKSLSEITNEANKWDADMLISIHVNAGGGTGFESFIYNGSVASQTVSNQNVIHDEIKKVMRTYGVRDRGKKRANFHVLRESRMSALLTENLFIDHSGDASLLKNDRFIDDVAQAHADGIANVYGLKRKATKVNETFYRVVTGSFTDKLNAEQRVKDLENKGFDSFIDVYKV